MAESGVSGADCMELSWRVMGAEFIQRTRGGESPERRDLAARTNGIGNSSVDDSDVVTRDSLDESRECEANSEISASIGGSSIMEHWRR
jgi:hypothetical protein